MQQWSSVLLTLSLLSITCFFYHAHAEDAHNTTITKRPVFLAAINPPAGFENLSSPSKTSVDVYFGNRYLAAQIATLTPGQIELSNPSQLVQLIGDVKDPELITSALTGVLNSHPELVCPLNVPRPCHTLSPKVAEVVYDEAAFRVDIFINPLLLRTRSANVRKYLPPSDAGFALMQNVSTSASGFHSTNNSDAHSYAINGLTMAAWHENSLRWDWSYADNERFSTRYLYGQRNYQGTEYSAGFMSLWGAGLSFLVDQPVLGIRTGSSDRTREDLEYSRGIPVDVYLPVRGWVEVRENDRLLYSAAYEAGAQQLDTSNFPDGAYDIDIRVFSDSGQLISSETRFFARQSQLPPLGEWLYQAELGRVVNSDSQRAMPEVTDQWQVRGSVSRRLSDTIAATAAAMLSDEQQLLELGGYFFGTHYQFTPSLMITNDGTKGAAVNGSITTNVLNLSGNLRRLWYHQHPAEQPDITDSFGSSVNQQSVSAAIPFWQGSFGYRYSRNQYYTPTGQLSDPEKSHFLDIRQTLFYSHSTSADLSLSLGKSGNTTTGMLTLNLRFRHSQWSVQASPRSEIIKQDGSTRHDETGRLSTAWYSGNQTEASLRVDAGIEAGQGNTRIDSKLQAANRFGQIMASANHGRLSNEQYSAWGVNINSRLLTDGHLMALGGEELTESALLVNVTGRPGDAFDVRVNNARHGYAIADSPSVISLSPYEQYHISLSSAGETLYYFEEREKKVTLYPGNVVAMAFKASPLLLIYGRILNEGKPLPHMTVSAGQYTVDTDESGLFQLEAPASIAQLLISNTDSHQCQLPLTPPEKGYVLPLGTINLEQLECRNTEALTHSNPEHQQQ
ncbi:TcfC E-set like domain-containing protein [uncultured Endozoicomonas sp.]|uniref:TcfC E-set like domain-containing protein n=1 Tax=uncultured Endozoicomonas sp. TaxID=432652 RepID=UPI002614F084|nr:TcfC E-set like domain-containing protein [uncultured Endozoicomonas sp.]